MMNTIDFVLPSCYGIPESMWLAASALLDTVLKRCWLLLGVFVVLKMIVSAFMDLGEERFSLSTQFKIIAQSFLIAVFLTYYKTFLMVFDYAIYSLSFFKPEIVQQTASSVEGISDGGNAITKWIIKQTGGFFLHYLTQEGMVKFMHYIKSVSLLILAILGPFSALFSLLPSPFRGSFKTWSKGYINVSCWTITLAVLEMLVVAFQATMGQNGGYEIPLSFVLFIMTFFVPTWTAKLISSVNLGNIAAGVGTGIGKTITGGGVGIGKAFSAGRAGIGKAFSAGVAGYKSFAGKRKE